MNLLEADFPFTLLTPCFSGTALGKLDDHAEMRIPPIRGHVRFWHRALFNAVDANRVWGSTNGNEGQGSRVGLRFSGAVTTTPEHPGATLLPHKDNPTHRGPRPAIAEGETITLQLQRLVGCTPCDWYQAQCAVRLWLLLGCLGLRSDRAAGSVWPLNAPADVATITSFLTGLGFTRWSIAVIGGDCGKTWTELRETASDTIKGNQYREIFGGISPRKPSPTRFKVIQLGRGLCLLGLAPGRQVTVNGNADSILRHAENLLNSKPTPERWNSLGAWNHILPVPNP